MKLNTMEKQYIRNKQNEIIELVKTLCIQPNQKEINQYIKEKIMLKNELHEQCVNHTY